MPQVNKSIPSGDPETYLGQQLTAKSLVNACVHDLYVWGGLKSVAHILSKDLLNNPDHPSLLGFREARRAR